MTIVFILVSGTAQMVLFYSLVSQRHSRPRQAGLLAGFVGCTAAYGFLLYSWT